MLSKTLGLFRVIMDSTLINELICLLIYFFVFVFFTQHQLDATIGKRDSVNQRHRGTFVNFQLLFLFLAVPHPLGLFTLSGANGTIDKSPRRLTQAVFSDITLAPGPFGNLNGSFFFRGNKDSYVKLKNTGELDARFSISVFVWVHVDNSSGLIYKYEHSNYYGCWMKVFSSNLAVKVRYMNRRGSGSYVLYKRNVLKANAWNFVGTTYNYYTGLATVFVNNSTVIQRNITARMKLATQYNVRVGSSKIQTKHFRGRISCLQIYDQALSMDQIILIKTRCNETSKYMIIFKSPFSGTVNPEERRSGAFDLIQNPLSKLLLLYLSFAKS